MSSATSFDQLKREAVNLERQLEDKIGRYQQVNNKSVRRACIKNEMRVMDAAVIVLLFSHSYFCLTFCFPDSWLKN